MIPLLARSACARTGLALAAQPPRLPRVSALRSLRAAYAARFASSTTRRNSPAPSSTALAPATPASPAPAAAAPPAPVGIIDRLLPNWAAPAKPYLYLLRLDKPIGTILLFWPCAWSITMAAAYTAAPLSVPVWYISLFGLGAVVMRGAGCIINDMWDAKMDAQVERTKTRPLAAGDITQFNALVFLGTQMAIGLAILTQLNAYSILLGMASLPLIVIYPFMKRVTYYPQAVLGACFTWGSLLGWAAVCGSVNWAVCGPLYAGTALYCIAYDTIYAHQDKIDDVKAGVKSTALAWGDKSKPIISTLYASFIGALAIAGHAAGVGPIYYAVSCLGTAAHLAWQVITVDLDSRPDCWEKFTSNGYVTGAVVWAGMAGDYLWRVVLPMIG